MRATVAPPFDPASLFLGGIGGGYWDLTDPSTLFADAAFTTPAVLNGQVLGIRDLSGNARHLTGVSATVLRRSGFVEFPGTQVGLSTPGAAQVGSAAGWTTAIAFRTDVVGAQNHWLDADSQPTRVGQLFFIGAAAQQVSLAFNAGTPVVWGDDVNGNILPGVDYASVSICTPTLLTMRRNKAVTAATVVASFPITNGSGRVGVGAAAGGTANFTQLPCKGRIYAALSINRVLTTQEISDLENWMYGKAGLPPSLRSFDNSFDQGAFA